MRNARALAPLTLLLLSCSTSNEGSTIPSSDVAAESSTSVALADIDDQQAPPSTGGKAEGEVRSPVLEPGVVMPGDFVELVTTQSLGVGYTISQLNADGDFVTRWGVVSDGNPGGSGSLEVFSDLAQFGYEDVAVPPTQSSRIQVPAAADAGLYTICPDNNPDLECFLLAIGELNETDIEACGPTCDGIEPGDPIPSTDFQPAYGWIRDDQLTFVVPLNRRRPDTFILETRESAAAAWQRTHRLISHPYGLTEAEPLVTSIELLDGTPDRTPEVIATGTHPVGNTWQLPAALAVPEGRLCSVDRQSMPCLYWQPPE